MDKSGVEWDKEDENESHEEQQWYSCLADCFTSLN